MIYDIRVKKETLKLSYITHNILDEHIWQIVQGRETGWKYPASQDNINSFISVHNRNRKHAIS